jgi:hypothetical protein
MAGTSYDLHSTVLSRQKKTADVNMVGGCGVED